MAENKAEKGVETETAEKTVRIRLPITGEGDVRVVWLNNRRFAIRRGDEVDVPEGVAKIIRESDRLEEERIRKVKNGYK